MEEQEGEQLLGWRRKREGWSNKEWGVPKAPTLHGNLGTTWDFPLYTSAGFVTFQKRVTMTVADIVQTGHRALGVRVIFKAGRKGIYFRSVKAETHVHMAAFFKTLWETTRAKGYEYLTFSRGTVNLLVLPFPILQDVDDKQVKVTRDNWRSPDPTSYGKKWSEKHRRIEDYVEKNANSNRNWQQESLN